MSLANTNVENVENCWIWCKDFKAFNENRNIGRRDRALKSVKHMCVGEGKDMCVGERNYLDQDILLLLEIKQII